MLCACRISRCGVFCVFFIKPCVAITKVFCPLRLSQKASNRYWMLSNNVRNSQISVFSNFLNNFGSLEYDAFAILYRIFARTLSDCSPRKASASSE